MADRSSARAFGAAFTLLAEIIPEGRERALVARRLWAVTRDYDFTQDQMDADEALFALGLARRGIDPDWPDDGEVTIYEPF